MKELTTRPNNFMSIDASTNSLAFAYFYEEKLKSYGKIKCSTKNFESGKNFSIKEIRKITKWII